MAAATLLGLASVVSVGTPSLADQESASRIPDHLGNSREVIIRGDGPVIQDGDLTLYPNDIVVRVEKGTTLTSELVEELRDLHSPVRAESAARDPELEVGGYAKGAGIVIEYVGTHPPAAAKAAIQAAATSWEEALVIMSPVTVEIEWVDLDGFIGSASTGFASHPSFPLPSMRYPTALANDFAGQDVNGVHSEIFMKISSSTDWYTGDGVGSFGGYDLETMALHELGHGLGFGLNGSDSMNLWDYIMTTGTGERACETGDYITYKTDPSINVFVSDTTQMKVYSPKVFAGGSSLSHFDEISHPVGKFGSLMTPYQGSGVTDRVLDGAVLGPISEMGWRMRLDPAHPVVKTSGPDGPGKYTVKWERGDISSALIPDYYLVQLVGNDNTVLTQEFVPETHTSFTFTGVANPDAVYALVYGHIFNGGTNTRGRLAASDRFSQPGMAPETPVPNTSPTGVSKSPLCPKSSSPDPAPDSEPSPDSGSDLGPSASTSIPSFVRDAPLDGQIYRLYRAYFNREPDEEGFKFWSKTIAETSAIAVSDSFAASQEFQTEYGSLSNAEFTNLVYSNVLGRAPDPAGHQYWVEYLGDGLARGELMLAFSDSLEFVDKTGTAPMTSSEVGKVTRLYKGFFLRDPDRVGLEMWVDYLAAGGDLSEIAEAFASSEEFTERYGSLSDIEFVYLIYANVLDRSPDTAGFTFWVSTLRAGLSRGTVMAGFTESAEFVTKTGTVK